MPNTGTQSTFVRRPDGDIDEDVFIPLSQIIGLVNGDYGAPVRLNKLNDNSNWAMEIKNSGSDSFGLVIRRGDGVGLLSVSNLSGVVAGVILKADAGLNVSGDLNANGGIIANINDDTRWDVDIKNSSTGGYGLRVRRADNTVLLSADALATFVGVLLKAAAGLEVTGDATISGDLDVAGTITGGIPSMVDTGSYTGAGTGGGGRNFTLGYQPKMVIITGGTTSATVEQYTSLALAYSVKLVNSGNPAYSTGVHLLTTGFRVSDGSTEGDVLGRNYDYIAFK